MGPQTCPDCDSPGDGNCSVCHGKRKMPTEEISAASSAFGFESACSACQGSGECQTCGGMGEIEVGGEGG